MTTKANRAGIPMEVAFAEEEQRKQLQNVTLRLRAGELDDLDKALPDVLGVARDAGNICALIENILVAGWLDANDPALFAVLRMTVRAVRSMEDQEFLALDRLDSALRYSERADMGGAA